MVVETEVVFLDRIIHKLPVLLGVKLYSEVREKFYKNLNVEDERYNVNLNKQFISTIFQN